jgi:hypothetical protein
MTGMIQEGSLFEPTDLSSPCFSLNDGLAQSSCLSEESWNLSEGAGSNEAN